jgi:hypothetical protein
VRKDIVGVGKIMKRMFASSGLLSLFSIQRYPITTRCCLQGKYENIASLRKAFLRRNVVAKWLYALLLVVLVLLCAALINDRVKEKVKKQEMLEYVKNQVDIDISKIYALVESKNTYFDAIQVLHAIDVISKRDSLVSLYADDPTSAIFVGSVWDQYFVPKYNQLIQELSTNRTKWPYPTY